MPSDLSVPVIALTLVTAGFLPHVRRRLFPPTWMEVLADYQIMSSYTGRSDNLFGKHMLKLRYVIDCRTFEKLVPVRYSLRTQEWEVIPQPPYHATESKLLIRVHPRKPQVICYQKSSGWQMAVPLLILGILWIFILSERHGS